jgi:hypothetical protein
MKRKLFVSLLAGAACYSFANAQPYFVPNATPVSQTVFSPTDPGKQQCNFFVWLPDRNRIWYDLVWAGHLFELPDTDSLFSQTSQLLAPLMDSFSADGLVRRVEIDFTQKPALFRVITHTGNAKAYTKMENELVQVKMDQDTLRMKVLSKDGKASFINLLLNNIADIKNIPPDAGKKSVDLIKAAIEKNYRAPIKNNPRHTYYGVFNLQTGEMISPEHKNYHAIRSGSDMLEITLLKPTLSYARGNVFTGFSMGAAFNYPRAKGAAGSRMGIGLYWEPQFAFSADASGKVQTYRNDFLNFRLEQFPKNPHANFELLRTLSLAYLINRSGNYFEKNTFRLGLPGVATGKLNLEPELYFNDFFKQVSPGIKLSMKIL